MKHWYTWISKHYKYNWWNIDIHEHQTLQVLLVKHWDTWILKHYKYNWWNIDIHEYQALQV
jgi:hypothetical protein